MKKNTFFIIILWAVLGTNRSAAGTETPELPYRGTIRTETIRLDQWGEMLYVDLRIIMENFRMKSPKGLDLIPQLVSKENTYALPVVSIKGKNQYLAYERKLSLMNKTEASGYQEPYEIKKSTKTTSDTLLYSYVLPFEPWMAGARLEIQYDLCGCGETALMEVVPLEEVSLEPVPYRIVPHLSYVQPEAEEVKRRQVQAESFLDFQVNKVHIRPEYMNNPRELGKIHSMIDELKADPDIQVNRLDIIGYASPEGTLEGNKRLSEGRAMALREYLAGQYEFPRALYHIVFGGENWKGLAQALDSVNVEYEEELMDLLENAAISDGERKIRLRQLRGGAPYRYLLQNVYPKLRVAICKVGYSIKNFDIQEAKEVIKKKPQNLSLNEIFLVANTYEQGSPEFMDVFETAVRMYPESEIANLNAAASALVRENPSLAMHYLQKVDPTHYPAQYNNLVGVMALLEEDYPKAQAYLQKAAEMGLDAAVLNLEELDRKKENMAEIETRKTRKIK